MNHNDNTLWNEESHQDFPGGAVVKYPPASAGDVGSNPGPGRSHMPQNNEARAPQLLSLRSRALRATTAEACAPQQEKPLQWEARTPQERVAHALCNWRKPARSNEDRSQPKINK